MRNLASVKKVIQMAQVLNKRPTEFLQIEGSDTYKFELDYLLLSSVFDERTVSEDERLDEFMYRRRGV